MAAYFHGNSEIQGGGGGGDGLQTLILMNPAYVNYSDNNNHHQPPPQNNHHNSSFAFPHAPSSQTQHFVGVPLQAAADHGGFLPPPRVSYSLYNLPIDLGSAARDATRAQQGLSLSLSSQQTQAPAYGPFGGEQREAAAPAPAPPSPPRGGEMDVRVSPSPASGVTNGVNGGVQSVLLSSKYLKAAQELLDEVVNVGKGGKSGGVDSSSKGHGKNSGETAAAAASGDGGQSGGDGGGGKRGAAELTTAERQEIQMKKAKLVNMLDEVEQRYRQYHHQMQIVISWFEHAAGLGSAKAYTALALQTISKQFRCLKDAILGQIRAASKSLGEDDSLDGKIEGSRLKYVDNQIRQQRALQQLGMIQHNAWRPQRGLPERSVSVLRAWLFEHFLHPYPKDSDKLMLAKQTGLTRSQVSNWFINARVRLWKPMVEEMYTEEMKEHEKNLSEDNKSKQNEDSTSKSTPPQAKSPNTELHNMNFTSKLQDNNHHHLINHNTTPPMISMSTNSNSPTGTTTMRHIPGFNLIGSSEIDSLTQNNNSPKKLRISDMLHSSNTMPSMSMGANKPTTNPDNDNMAMKSDGFTLMGAPTNFIGGFGSYPMGELGRFGPDHFQAPFSGNGVSLTLGLPHCDNLGAHQNFLPNQLGRGVEIGEANDFSGMNGQTNAHSNNVYENISIQDRKRFVAQLLPDFVA